MVLNLAALASIVGAIVIALILFRRYVPRAISGGDNVCLRCGAAAAWLTSFTCPACGHDVREAGVGPVRGRTPSGTFWLVVAFSCGYLIASQVLIAMALNAAPSVYRSSRNISMRVSSPTVHAVDLFLEARGVDENHSPGTITGELYAAGGVVVLEADVPSLRWRLLDPDRKTLDSGERLDGRTVYRWMERGGVPTDSAVAHSDAAQIANHLGQLTRTRLTMPPVPGTGRALSLSYSATSGGGSSYETDPRWRPALVIISAAAWVACVWLILLWRRGAQRQGAPA